MLIFFPVFLLSVMLGLQDCSSWEGSCKYNLVLFLFELFDNNLHYNRSTAVSRNHYQRPHLAKANREMLQNSQQSIEVHCPQFQVHMNKEMILPLY